MLFWLNKTNETVSFVSEQNCQPPTNKQCVSAVNQRLTIDQSIWYTYIKNKVSNILKDKVQAVTKTTKLASVKADTRLLFNCICDAWYSLKTKYVFLFLYAFQWLQNLRDQFHYKN